MTTKRLTYINGKAEWVEIKPHSATKSNRRYKSRDRGIRAWKEKLRRSEAT